VDRKRLRAADARALGEPNLWLLWEATKLVDPSGGKGPKGPVGGTGWRIVDGVLRPIRGDGAVGEGARSLSLRVGQRQSDLTHLHQRSVNLCHGALYSLFVSVLSALSRGFEGIVVLFLNQG